jgi:hypothetical protein
MSLVTVHTSKVTIVSKTETRREIYRFLQDLPTAHHTHIFARRCLDNSYRNRVFRRQYDMQFRVPAWAASRSRRASVHRLKHLSSRNLRVSAYMPRPPAIFPLQRSDMLTNGTNSAFTRAAKSARRPVNTYQRGGAWTLRHEARILSTAIVCRVDRHRRRPGDCRPGGILPITGGYASANRILHTYTP